MMTVIARAILMREAMVEATGDAVLANRVDPTLQGMPAGSRRVTALLQMAEISLPL